MDELETSIKILYDTAIFHLYVPAFFEVRPLDESRKLLTMMFKESWRNEAAIATLRDLAPKWLEAKKAARDAALLAYQQEWKDIETVKRQYPHKRTMHYETRKRNRELTDSLRRAKSEYEKMLRFCVKLQGLIEKYL